MLAVAPTLFTLTNSSGFPNSVVDVFANISFPGRSDGPTTVATENLDLSQTSVSFSGAPALREIAYAYLANTLQEEFTTLSFPPQAMLYFIQDQEAATPAGSSPTAPLTTSLSTAA